MKTLKKTIENGKVFESLIEIDTKTGEILSRKTKQISLKEKPTMNFSILLDSGEKAIYRLETFDGTTMVGRYFPPSTKSWLDYFVPSSGKSKNLCRSVFAEIEEINAMEKARLAKLEVLEVNETIIELINDTINDAVNNRIRTLKKLQDLLDKYNSKHGTINTVEDFAKNLETVQGIPCSLVKAEDLA